MFRAQESTDPLERFLSRKRSELPRLITDELSTSRVRAAETWNEIRVDHELSRCFDEHMVKRATTAEIFPGWMFAHPKGVVIDVGGGPGHYLARALASAGRNWTGVLCETYPEAGRAIFSDVNLTHRVQRATVPVEGFREFLQANVYFGGRERTQWAYRRLIEAAGFCGLVAIDTSDRYQILTARKGVR